MGSESGRAKSLLNECCEFNGLTTALVHMKIVHFGNECSSGKERYFKLCSIMLIFFCVNPSVKHLSFMHLISQML